MKAADPSKLKSKRKHNGPSLSPPPALEALAIMAGNTAYRIPVGGRGTQPGRTSLDIAAELSVGSSRMSEGHAWANIAVLVATARPVTTETICDMVDAVINPVASLLKAGTATKLRGGKLRIMLHMLIANAVGPRATRKVAAGKEYGWVVPDEQRPKRRKYVVRDVEPHQVRHPEFRQRVGWLPTYTERAAALRMRRTEYAAIERELQAIIESHISEAAAACGMEGICSSSTGQ